MSRIEVWCLGNPTTLQNNTHLKVEPRQPTTAGWGKDFQARFFIDSPSDVESASKVLYTISYPLS